MKTIIHNIPFGFYLGGGERLLKGWNDNSLEDTKNYLIYEKRKQNINDINFDNFTVLEHNDFVGLNEVFKLSKPNVIVEHGIGWVWNEYNTIYKGVNSKIVHYIHNEVIFKNFKAMQRFGIKISHVISNYEDKVLRHSDINYLISPLQLDLQQYPFVKRRYDIKNIKVGIVGRISDEKIPLSFIHELKKFSEKNKQYTFYFLGAGLLYLDTLKEEIKDCERIIYDGCLKMDEMNIFYNKIDILLSPSLSESGGYAILEAMATGLPTIARSTGGLKETVGYGGLVSENNSDKELLFLLDNMTEADLENYSFLARQKVEEYNGNPKEQYNKLNKFILS